MSNRLTLALWASLIALSACGGQETGAAGDSAAAEEAAPSEPSSDDGRLAGDAERDPMRKPEETLAFFGVEPGMLIFEIEAGGGYFTEVFAKAVGPEGMVVAQNPESFIPFFEAEMEKRYADGRLENATRSYSLFDNLDPDDASVDLATWIQGPHELYYKPEDGSSVGDPAATYAEIYRILKPGAVFGVIDHSAVAGAPSSTGNDLHRIDKSIVIEAVEAAGFTLEAEADFLANPDDDLQTLAFSGPIRGKTDQFVLRFRKPSEE